MAGINKRHATLLPMANVEDILELLARSLLFLHRLMPCEDMDDFTLLPVIPLGIDESMFPVAGGRGAAYVSGNLSVSLSPVRMGYQASLVLFREVVEECFRVSGDWT